MGTHSRSRSYCSHNGTDSYTVLCMIHTCTHVAIGDIASSDGRPLPFAIITCDEHAKGALFFASREAGRPVEKLYLRRFTK